MSWLSGILGAVTSPISAVTGSLFGTGNKTSTSSQNVAPASQEEQDLLKKLLQESDLSNAPGAQGGDPELFNLFKQNLAKYLGGSYGQVTPDVLKQATDYVDQTFTNPMQQSFDQFQRQYMASQDELAGQLGRSPMDSSIQQQNFRTLADISNQNAAQRGSQIAQRSDLLAYQRPMEQLQMGAQGLGFINNLNQQAFKNRLGLMNLQSGLQKNMQNYRLSSAGKTTTNQGTDQGILGNLGQLASAPSAIGTIGSKLGLFA